MFDDVARINNKVNVEPPKSAVVEKPLIDAPTEQPNTSKAAELDFGNAALKFKLENLWNKLPLDAPPVEAQNLVDTGYPQEAQTGDEAAARLKNKENYWGPEAQNNRGRDFMETVNAHKNDPEFLNKMYQSLGPEETARLLEDTSHAVRNDNRNDFPNESDVRGNYEAIAKSLAAMPDSFQYEVGANAVKQGNYEVGIILSQAGGGTAAKRGFLDAIKADALGGDEYKNYIAARMTGEVLASDPQLVKEYLAGGRDDKGNWIAPKWSAAETSKLFKNGLAMPPLGDTYHYDWSLMKGEGLERVVGMAADLKGADYSDFRARVFRDAATVLKDTHTGDRLRQSLVDNLQKLFLSDPRGIVDKLFDNNGPDSPYDGSGQALSLFLREAVFANPNPDGEMVNAVSNLMGDLRADMLNPDNKGKSPNNEYYAKLLGDVLGSVASAYKRAVKDNGEDQKTREALVGTLVDLAAKPIEVGGGEVGSMAKEQAKELVKSLLSDFLNGDLKADEKGMQTILNKLFDTAFAGARDFDSKNGTNIEANVKVETIWVDFLRELFG